jgi:Ca2+-binding RTX toxin-like protein
MSTFGALDIAVLQSFYGSNQTHNSGASNYELGVDELYKTIWDTGGIDEIVVNTGSDAVVDLRPASLEYEIGGAGFVSFVNDTVGGFTIAHGTTIENVSGGSGNDLINGNLVSNLIYGNEGNDTICGADGDDLIFGGLGDDIIEGGCGNDILDGGGGNDTFLIRSGEGSDIIYNYDLSADSILFESSEGVVINNDQISRERSEDGSRKYILNQDTVFTLSGIMNFSAEGHADIDLSGLDNRVLQADVSCISDVDGMGSLSFQWFRDGIELIEETEPAYHISLEDVSAELHYEVSFKDWFGANECLSSDKIKIEEALFSNCVPTGSLTISGEFVVGQVISLDTTGIQDNDGLGAFSFAWLRDGNIIAGAQSAEYLLADIDVDTSISAQLSYIDEFGTEEIIESIASHKIERLQNDVGQENLDAASDVTTTSSMHVDGSFSGSLSSGDYSDWIGVDLISGENYTISLSGVGQDAVEDTYLRIFDANGAFIASDDDSGSGYNSLLSVAADYSGRFYLEAQSYYSYDSGNYEITIDQIERLQNDVGQENLDAASDVTTTSSMHVDGSFSGSLSSGDYSDWISVDLISGENYTISLSGVGQDAVEDTYLSMFDANGAFIASDDDSGSGYNSMLSVAADYSGRFYLEAQSYYSYDSGNYEITIDLIA